jgi:hypothetical protein
VLQVQGGEEVIWVKLGIEHLVWQDLGQIFVRQVFISKVIISELVF